MAYREHFDGSRRLRLLKILYDVQGYKANELIVGRMLDAFGYSVSSDQVRTDLAWLSEQGLLTVEELGDLQIAELTARGADVATGKIATPGVHRPQPGR
jgi:hypothetical protein